MEKQQVIILQGVSGSGKSTLAAKFHEELNAIIVSADNYFIDNGEYKFDVKLLGKAHASCFLSFMEAVDSGENVVVDNTNTTATEIMPYSAYVNAKNFALEVEGYNEVVDFKIIWVQRDIEKCIAGNLHGVPAGGVRAQAKRIDSFNNSGGNVYKWPVEKFENNS